MTEEGFNELRKVDLENYPEQRFRSILYEVDYMFNGQKYSIVVTCTGGRKIEKFDPDMEAGTAAMLKKEGGKWGRHDLELKNSHMHLTPVVE